MILCHVNHDYIWLTDSLFFSPFLSLSKAIFDKTNLAVIRLSDRKLFVMLFFALSLECIILILFLIGGFSEHSLDDGRGDALGTVHWECVTDSTSYSIWLSAHIAFLALTVFTAAYFAFLVKDVVSDFNESTYIVACVYAFIFVCVLLIPMDFLMASNTTAVAFVRCVGQLVIALTLTLVMIVPKVRKSQIAWCFSVLGSTC